MRLDVFTFNGENRYTGYRVGHYFVGLRPGNRWVQTSHKNLTSWPPDQYAVICLTAQRVVARSNKLIDAILWAKDNQ